MNNWNRGGRTYKGFPENVKRQAERQLPKRCNNCGATDTPLELDHRLPTAEGGTDDISNAQWLCTSCHTPKTRAEIARGRARRAARGRRPPEKHPGLA